MCAVPSQPMGRYPWDSHRNDIPMDKPADYEMKPIGKMSLIMPV